MILYLDTSALLKKYFKEDGSGDIITLWKKTEAIVTSKVAYAETMASIFRKKKENKNVHEKHFESAIRSFEKDWTSFIRVDVNNDLNEKIRKLVAAHPLRGFDAIHLASALTVRENIHQNFVFACYDRRLSKAAEKEGLGIFPENFQEIAWEC